MYYVGGASMPHCTRHECTLLGELVLKLLAYVIEGACTEASTDFAGLASTQRQVVQRHELRQMQKTEFSCSGRFQAFYLFASATARGAYKQTHMMYSAGGAYNQAHMMYSAGEACIEALLDAHRWGSLLESSTRHELTSSRELARRLHTLQTMHRWGSLHGSSTCIQCTGLHGSSIR